MGPGSSHLARETRSPEGGMAARETQAQAQVLEGSMRPWTKPSASAGLGSPLTEGRCDLPAGVLITQHHRTLRQRGVPACHAAGAK